MAKIKVRYLATRKGSPFPRYFWVPGPSLRQLGYEAQRLPEDWERYSDGAALETAAIAAAQAINRAIDERKAKATPEAPAIQVRTLDALIDLYELSDWYTVLAPKTKTEYAKCIKRLRAWAGDCPVKAIDDVRIDKLRRGMKQTPAFANAVVRVLRRILAFGVKKGWVIVNTASKPGLVSTAPSGKIWPRKAVEAFVAAADELGAYSIGTAVMLDEWLGQREGDILRLPRTVYRNGELIFRQAKGQSLARGTQGAGIVLPVDLVPELKARLALQLTKNDEGKLSSLAIIQSEVTKQPYKDDFFRHEFARVRAHAAKTHPEFELDYLLPGRDIADPNCFKIRMEELQFMHLRHTAITRLAEHGVSAENIAAVSGHSFKTVLQILERYMIRTRTMAVSAFTRRLEGEGKAPVPAAQEEQADGN